jgi:predicted DNA-binding antitoxin AbrB/MazE fold protein
MLRGKKLPITITATFDGGVLRPDEPLDMEPNSRVHITIEVSRPPTEKTLSLLDTAASLNLEGPSDWSIRICH